MEHGISDIISGGDSFISSASPDLTVDTDKIKDVSNTVYNILFVIGMSVALIIGVILGIQFMIASVEEKAKIKEAIIPFLIGCIVIFGAFTIWQLAVNVASNLS